MIGVINATVKYDIKKYNENQVFKKPIKLIQRS